MLVVEHDEDTIRAADHVVDMGPRAGVHGGRIVAAGTPEDIVGDPRLADRRVPVGAQGDRGAAPAPPAAATAVLTVSGARGHNLRGLDGRASPSACSPCVTGVSGSGKSTLVIDTLLPALHQRLHAPRTAPGEHDSIDGLQHVDKVIDIDQSPIGRTPRSNPATYTGVFTHIRDLFATLPESKARGYKPGRYSFNVKGGRCEACQGDGIMRIEMHFLPDVYVACEACGGRRYNRETLEVKYGQAEHRRRARHDGDAGAASSWRTSRKVRQKLETLRDVGLGYITLGQSATTLSGGEAQRIKLSKELAKKRTGRTRLHPRRADHRPALRRHRAAAACSTGWSTRATP